MKTSLVTLILILCCAALGQQHQNQTQYPTVIYLGPATQQTRMTVDDVMKMSKAGLSDDVIIQQLKKEGRCPTDSCRLRGGSRPGSW